LGGRPFKTGRKLFQLWEKGNKGPYLKKKMSSREKGTWQVFPRKKLQEEKEGLSFGKKSNLPREKKRNDTGKVVRPKKKKRAIPFIKRGGREIYELQNLIVGKKEILRGKERVGGGHPIFLLEAYSIGSLSF